MPLACLGVLSTTSGSILNQRPRGKANSSKPRVDWRTSPALKVRTATAPPPPGRQSMRAAKLSWPTPSLPIGPGKRPPRLKSNSAGKSTS
jgi:hypothetical protein